MHGWVYDVAGHCLEQPAEPDETFKDRIQHPAYPCQDLGGLVFAYMGPPDKMPLLPRYDVLVRPDGSRRAEWYAINGGYLQHVEGALDTVHAAYLHMAHWSEKKLEMTTQPKPVIDVEETDYGVWSRIYKSHPGAVMGTIFSHFIMPSGFLLQNGKDYEARPGQMRDGVRQRSLYEISKYQSWYTPVDDGHCLRFRVMFVPLKPDGTPYDLPPDGELAHPRADQDYGRDYVNVDSISGIDPQLSSTFRSQDTMSNETQGTPYMDRSREHLGAHDYPLTMTRMVILKAIADVQKGLDPKHIFRDPSQNEIVYIRGNDPQELFDHELAALGARS